MTVVILRDEVCDCESTAVPFVWLCIYCSIGIVTVRILRYGFSLYTYCAMGFLTVQILRYCLCDCADTALCFV